jgi:hypothetical protein
MQHHRNAGLCKLPGGLGAGEAASDHMNALKLASRHSMIIKPGGD